MKANGLLALMFGRKNLEDDSTPSLGKVWQGLQALKAYKNGNLFTNRTGPRIRICIRHLVEKEEDEVLHTPKNKKSVWYSWVDDKGRLHPFRKVVPMGKSGIVDIKTARKEDQIESSFLGHAFIFVVRETDDDDDEKWEVKSLDDATVIGGYRPQLLSTNPDIKEDDYPCHMLDIIEEDVPSFLRACAVCQPGPKPASNDFPFVIREGNCLEPLDTTTKEYVKETICGWPVFAEKGAFNDSKEFKETFQKDLEYVVSHIPGYACKALKESNTHIYVNKTFYHGPKIRPIKAKACCFHPCKNWLAKHGYSVDKIQCVELYSMSDYLKDRKYWGTGGLLMHELAHAYHNKCLPDGYENTEIRECYEHAMDEGLYSLVKVHGPQGPTARAYACSNQMEYFAELSTAFLGVKKEGEEYNKWYPFNRPQVKEHDPRAYALLKKLWKV
eukprot:scaffold1564_cov174-Amphora_coffeaeformis.AAC.23